VQRSTSRDGNWRVALQFRVKGPGGETKPRKAKHKAPCRFAEAGAEKERNDGRVQHHYRADYRQAEQGTVPWHKPWRGVGAPRNLASKKPYRGVNVWLLTAAGYTSPYWATIRQVNELGGHIRKGEKATPVVFWRVYVDGIEAKAGEPEPDGQEAEGQGRRRFVLRYYSVFNTEHNASCPPR
jgi:antirestriction protein ArdC